MHNPGRVLENETHKPLLDFDIKTDHLISTRRPDLVRVNNNKKGEKRERKPTELGTLPFWLAKQ